MDFDNKLKPKPITSANQTVSLEELESLAQEYAKWFKEYVNYNGSQGVKYLEKTIQPNISRITERITELVGYDNRYNVMSKYVKDILPKGK